ncbi:MAG: hypothetical protein GY765_11005 [bacterium]|nr:hypothetical protein [bacterium]
MKKLIILVALFVMVAFVVEASVVVNGVDINKEDIRYCQLLAKGRLLSTKVTIIVDYGQKTKLFGKAQKIKSDTGKSVKFFSPIDALNFMDQNGWEHVDSYFLTVKSTLGKSQTVLHYLLKKKE